LKALKFPKDTVEAVAQLVDQHLRFHGYGDVSDSGQPWTDAAVRRYVRDAGDELERLHILTRSDCTTRNPRKAEKLRRAYDELEYRIDELSKQEALDAMRPDLDGQQIMEILGIKPGPVVGRAYKYLLNRRIEEGPLGPDKAREELLTWWSSQPESQSY
jgi:poly(A) polymerase